MNQPKTNIRYILSCAIVRKLWAQGLITEEELKKILEKNAKSFLLKEA